MMIRKILLLILALSCLAAAGVLLARSWEEYHQTLAVLPPGSNIAGVPVGGISAQEAGVRLAQVYMLTPVEAHLKGTVIHLNPQKVGFELNLNEMLDQAGQDLSIPFWNFLQNQRPQSVTVPLLAQLDQEKLKRYIETELSPAYTRFPTAAYGLPTGMDFQPGQAGEVINVEDAIDKISSALFTLDQRVVNLTTTILPALPPDFDQLDPMLASLIQTSGFNGIIEVYVQDLATRREINLAYARGKPVSPDIAFTAASTIKIPVMVSAFRELSELSDRVRQQLELMIDLSDNDSTDRVMRLTMDENLAPLQVTRDLRQLGFKNTFLAGMFYPGAPLLDRFSTPANQRTDLTTEPDPYNQTSALEMGRLLAEIQRCADQQDNLLTSVFADAVTPSECQTMVEILKKNRKAVLIEAGIPEGVEMAHKYGWVTDPADGLMHHLSDAAIVYPPGGNFVLSIYVYDSEQLLWDPAQALVARLTMAVSSYYNFLSSLNPPALLP